MNMTTETTVQHIYEGDGSPYDLGVVAPAGAHYIDRLDDNCIWIASSYWPGDEESPAETRWLKFVEDYLPGEAPFFSMHPGEATDLDTVIVGGTFLLGRDDKTVYCNVPLEQHQQGGNDFWRYYSAEPYRLSVKLTFDGNIIVIITALQTQDWGETGGGV